MKKLIKPLFLALSVSLLTVSISQAQQAQFEVRIRPSDPRENVAPANLPPRPSPSYVWAGEGWSAADGHYVYKPGYWVIPPRGASHWVKGHWNTTRRGGYYWVPGHWV